MSMRIEEPLPVEAAHEPIAADGSVKARGYWELVWIRFRRDKLAVASIFFIVFLLLAAFVGGPVAAHILGHGPNQPFNNPGGGIDINTLAPVGPLTHITYLDFN